VILDVSRNLISKSGVINLDCEHKKLTVVIRDFGIFDEKFGTYRLKNNDYMYDEEFGWSEWTTFDGYRDEVIGEIKCENCDDTFYEDGYITMPPSDPMYEKIEKLVKILNMQLRHS
jgi:hypothetical protein